MEITNFCDAVYRLNNGEISVHNPHGPYDYDQVCQWAQENPDMVLPYPYDLAALKEGLKARIEQTVASTLDQGFEFPEGSGVFFPADIGAQASVERQVRQYARTSDPSWLGFKSKGGAWVPMTSETFEEFQDSGADFVFGFYQRVWAAKAAIDAAQTPEEAQSLFESGNWT